MHGHLPKMNIAFWLYRRDNPLYPTDVPFPTFYGLRLRKRHRRLHTLDELLFPLSSRYYHGLYRRTRPDGMAVGNSVHHKFGQLNCSLSAFRESIVHGKAYSHILTMLAAQLYFRIHIRCITIETNHYRLPEGLACS